MKRDLDLIRAILLDIEAHNEPIRGTYSYAGSDIDAFEYAMKLMREKGLIDCAASKPLKGPITFYGVSITWAGSDFLDTVRDEEIWRKTKAGAEQAKGFTFDLLKRVATGLIETQLEKYTGVKLGN